MLSSWISKGSQIISTTTKSITQQGPSMESSAMLKQILTKLQAKLSRELGQNVQGGFASINAEILKQTQLEKNVLEIKEKYNNLVAQSETQSQCLKAMMHSFVELLKGIANGLENQDMVTPLKDLEAAFYACNTSKVEKQLKYFSKLYEAALQDYLKARLSGKQEEKKDQISLFKNLNKNLEVELFRSRNNSSDLQKRLNEIHSKNQELTDKLSILQKLGAESAVLASNKEKQRFAEKQSEMLERIKILQREKAKLERVNRELDAEVVKVTSAIEVLKVNQQNIVEQMRRQITKKESGYEALISKIRHEKLNLEDRIKSLTSELQTISQQLTHQKKSLLLRKESQPIDTKPLTQKIKQLEQQIASQTTKMQSLVSKQIMKSLFVNFEDESKDWSTRKDIKNQIYLLLDIKVKKEEREEKKWFGIF